MSPTQVKGKPPPLPPRQSSSQARLSEEDAPPAYDAIAAGGTPEEAVWSNQDARSSSQQSLAPPGYDEQNGRRRLLMIYIHGFMGNETSFRSFPAHVHHLLTVLLAETHVIHTKIYPRYKSRRKIGFARDAFSNWLEPHEDAETDVVLLGHSMGGLLSAEVAIMPPSPPATRPLKHRILGTINFDVPFLGMHPGIIRSGLTSIFNPSEEPQDNVYSAELIPMSNNDGSSTTRPNLPSPRRSDTLWTPEQEDPNFNPSFQNDVVLPTRKGWRNAWHFVSKHSNDLRGATKQLISSHMEFGGAMANYGELKARYCKIRGLEEEEGSIRKTVTQGDGTPARVRFINYYTASSGRPKAAKLPESTGSATAIEKEADLGSLSITEPTLTGDDESVVTKHSRISTDENEDNTTGEQSSDQYRGVQDWEAAVEALTRLDPKPEVDEEESSNDGILSETMTPTSSMSTLSPTASLPPIPDLPPAPPPLDVSYVQDPEVRKLVEKEHFRAVKAYEKSIRDREKIVRDRAKFAKAQEHKSRKDAEKAARDSKNAKHNARHEGTETKKEMSQSQKEMLRLEKERLRMAAEARRMRGEPEPSQKLETPTSNVTAASSHPDVDSSPPNDLQQVDSINLTGETDSTISNAPIEEMKPKPPPKERKFCILPPKDSNGQRDPCWVRIFMKDVDEVGAHCGLFFVDERYERLVGDVADRVEGWVREDHDGRMSRRMQETPGTP